MLNKGGISQAVRHLPLTTDDHIVLRAEKKKIVLAPSYKRRLIPDGVTHRWTPPNSEHEVDCKGRVGRIRKDITFRERGSVVDIEIGTLWDDMRPRRDVCFDAVRLAFPHLLAVPPISARRSLRDHGRQHADRYLRDALRSVWKVARYEHNLLLPPDIGRVLLEEISEFDEAAGEFPPTVYVSGFHSSDRERDKPAKVFAYPMQDKHGVDAVKIEVGLRGYALRKDRPGGALLSPAGYNDQPAIQSTIEPDLRVYWSRVFRLAEKASDTLMQRLGVQSLGEMLDSLLDPQRTLKRLSENGL